MFKRHRDVMFSGDPDGKPISIIISTLAAHAYQGETDLREATINILDRMPGLINPQHPRVPNPVDPEEDFADKWDTPEGRQRRLEGNFRMWAVQAQSDFRRIADSRDTDFISEMAKGKFHVQCSSPGLRDKVGIVAPVVVAPKAHDIAAPARPWRS
jgi:hypothetical protein